MELKVGATATLYIYGMRQEKGWVEWERWNGKSEYSPKGWCWVKCEEMKEEMGRSHTE